MEPMESECNDDNTDDEKTIVLPKQVHRAKGQSLTPSLRRFDFVAAVAEYDPMTSS